MCIFNVGTWEDLLTRKGRSFYDEKRFQFNLSGIKYKKDKIIVSDLSENNVVRFISISKKKEGFFVNYRVKGTVGGTTFSSSICVDLAESGFDESEPLEKIIEECARVAVREFEKTKFKFERAILSS